MVIGNTYGRKATNSDKKYEIDQLSLPQRAGLIGAVGRMSDCNSRVMSLSPSPAT